MRQIHLVKGGAKTYDDYQRRVGFIEGVNYAIDAGERLQETVANARSLRAEAERVE